MQSFHLDRAKAEELLEVYKGVVPEYQAMVEEFISGSCIALEVPAEGFREFVGPRDSELAKVLRPLTLRAKFGTDGVDNAVHCTDLDDDRVLETEYFFRVLSPV
jgi:nucleoside-diphosphate kinase